MNCGPLSFWKRETTLYGSRTFGGQRYGLHTLSAQANKPALHIYFTADPHLVATTNSHSSGVIVFSHHTLLYILQHNDKLNKTFIFSLKPINQVKAWTFGLGSMCTSNSDGGEFISGHVFDILNLCIWFSLHQLPGKMFGAEQEAYSLKPSSLKTTACRKPKTFHLNNKNVNKSRYRPHNPKQYAKRPFGADMS